LKDRQQANVALDKKKQILNSLNIRDLNDEAAANKYKEVVLSDDIVDTKGELQQKETKDNESSGFKLNSANYKNGELAIFTCKVDGATKYVIPVYGAGLWGPISGYIALNDDCETVFGAYFDHEGETAGLGAEIKDSRSWQEKFKDKKLFAPESDKVILSVEKKVTDATCQVDAVTGATLTSNGVRDMLQEGLAKYVEYFKKIKK
jgi:Na+-transporting NADH:ubiquinone oxidoreductase subunit C